MGALDYKTRRHRRNRLAAEMAATYHPRKHFRLGQDIGWHWQIDDPNLLYRRRNRLTYTRDFSNAAWSKTAILSTTSDADGVGDLVVPNTTATVHVVAQNLAVAGVGGVLTVRAKPGGYNFLALQLGTTNAAYFNLSTGVVSTAPGGTATATIAAAVDASGYYDCTLTNTNPLSTSCAIYVIQANGTPSFAGDGTSGVYIARAQLETYTTTPTEYQDVPTTWPQAYLAAVGAERIYAWKDTAGTDPVTAVGEGIGLLLGREYGGVRGVELFPSLNFSAGLVTGLVTGTTANTFTTSGAGGLRFAGIVSVGKMYEVRITGTVTAGTFSVRNPSNLTNSASGTGTFTINARLGWSTTAEVYFQNDAAATTTITSISVREIPGTHLIQATGTARPTLSARVNLLLSSDDITAVSWTKVRGSVTANAATVPGYPAATLDQFTEDSTATNTHVVYQGALAQNVSYKFRFLAKYNGRNIGVGTAATAAQLGVFDLQTGAAQVTGSFSSTNNSVSGLSIKDLGSGVYECSGTILFGGVGGSALCLHACNGTTAAYTGNGSSGFFLGEVDLRTADDAAKNLPAYQRVGATASDHDTDGFPHYAEGDGTDNCWASVATVDGSAHDKISFVVAVTKLVDAASIVLEHGPVVASTNGTFGLRAASTTVTTADSYAVEVRGSSARQWRGVNGFAAPITSVVASQPDLTSNSAYSGLSVQVNGVTPAQVGIDPTAPGGGNYSAQTLYVLSRTGTSLRFNGRFYGSTGRFGPMGDSERNNLTRWWQKRIGTA